MLYLWLCISLPSIIMENYNNNECVQRLKLLVSILNRWLVVQNRSRIRRILKGMWTEENGRAKLNKQICKIFTDTHTQCEWEWHEHHCWRSTFWKDVHLNQNYDDGCIKCLYRPLDGCTEWCSLKLVHHTVVIFHEYILNDGSRLLSNWFQSTTAVIIIL